MATAILYDKWGKQITSNQFSSQTRKVNSPVWTTARNLNWANRNLHRFLNPSEMAVYKSIAVDLFRSSPVIHGAISTLSGWVGSQGWRPKLQITDKKIRQEFNDFLEDIFRNPTIYGVNMTINRAVVAMRNELATAGDFVYFITKGKGSTPPRLAIYPGTMVGNRSVTSPVIQKGSFAGHIIDNGVITERETDQVLGYRMLGATEKEDKDFGLSDGITLIHEPETFAYRGISQLAASLITSLDIDDISQDYSQIIRNENAVRVLGKVHGGDGRAFVDPLNPLHGMMARDGASPTAKTASPLDPKVFQKNGITFIDTDEDLKSFESNRPSVNGQDWVRYLTEGVVYSSKWMLALMSPEKLNTGNLQMIETQIQQWQLESVETIKRVVRHYAVYCLAWAQDRELITDIPIEWRNVDFTPPPLFTLKSMTSEYIQQMDNGVLTPRGYNEANGVDHDRFVIEQEAELLDEIERAERIAGTKPWLKPEDVYNRIVSKGNAINVARQEISTKPSQ